MIHPITIDIYSDTICPWCYIGHNKLLSAINSASQFKFDLVWRPFQLNHNIPNKGMQRQLYLESKFGGKQKAKDAYQKIYNIGIENKKERNPIQSIVRPVASQEMSGQSM